MINNNFEIFVINLYILNFFEWKKKKTPFERRGAFNSNITIVNNLNTLSSNVNSLEAPREHGFLTSISGRELVKPKSTKISNTEMGIVK